MIADLKPYPEYKESGIRWAPSLPATWRTERAKWLFTKMARPMRLEDEVITCFRDGMVTLRRNRRLRGFTEATAEFGYQGVRKGDLVIHGMDAFAGAIGVSDSDGKGTPVYNICKPKPGVIASYYAHAIRQMSQSQWILALAKGIRERSTDFRYEMFGNQRVPLPSTTEQAAIVRFLDWATGRMDRAIRAKRKMVSLLNEQKQAIIHRAVSRGLDPSVPLKPSGIPWLGDTPTHWSLKRFKFLATINRGQVDPRKTEYRNLVLIAPNHIQSGSGRLLKQETADEQGADSGKYYVHRGQVIYSKIRPNLRKATIAPCDCLCSADMYPITPRTEDLSTEYLLLLLLSQPFTKFAVDTSMRVAMPKVNREALANCLMWYPSRQEQLKILEFIDNTNLPLNIAISSLEREIHLLREYRTRLVADVVTGKLDVREAAAHIPDDAPPEPDEDNGLDMDLEPADEDIAI